MYEVCHFKKNYLSKNIRERNRKSLMLQILLVKWKFFMMLKMFWLYLLVAHVMSGYLISVVHFIFILIEAGLTLVKLSIVLFY